MRGFIYLESEGNSDGSSDWESLVVDAVGNVIEFWGFKRNQGRVWALIFLRGRPLSASEIQLALGLSKGAVSMITRELERWEVLTRGRSPNDPAWRFQAETDLRRMISNVVRERESVFISRVRADLEEAERRAEAERAPSEVLERLRRMRRLADAMGGAIELFLTSARLDLGRMVNVLKGTTDRIRRAGRRSRKTLGRE